MGGVSAVLRVEFRRFNRRMECGGRSLELVLPKNLLKPKILVSILEKIGIRWKYNSVTLRDHECSSRFPLKTEERSVQLSTTSQVRHGDGHQTTQNMQQKCQRAVEDLTRPGHSVLSSPFGLILAGYGMEGSICNKMHAG